MRGNLVSGLSLYGVNYRLDQLNAQIQRVELNWQPMALLKGTIQIRKLYMQELFYRGPDSIADFKRHIIRFQPIISFPFEVVIDEANLNQLKLYQGGNQYSAADVHLSGRADRSGLGLKRFEVEGEGLHFGLRGYTGFSHPYRFKGKLNWGAELPNNFYVRGTGDISGDLNLIEFTHKLIQPFSAETRGKIELNRKLTESKRNNIGQKADRFSTDEATLQSVDRQSRRKGNPDSYQLEIKTDLNVQGLPIMEIDIRGRGDLTNFQVEKLEAQTLGGTVKAKGKLVWQSRPKWEFSVTAANIDPGVQWPNWPGKLALNAKLKGEMDRGISTLSLADLDLYGHLLEQPLSAEGKLTLIGKRLLSGELRVLSGKNQLKVSGTAAENLDLNFNLETPDPEGFWPGLKGKLQVKGFIKGPRNNPSATLSIEGGNLIYNTTHYGHHAVKNLDAYLKFDSKDMPELTAEMNLENLQINNQTFSGLSLKWFGSLKNHRVWVDLDSASVGTEVKFSGSYHDDVWRVNVAKASVILNKFGLWNLDSPVSSLVSHRELKPFEACWVHEKSRVCVRGSWNAETGWTADGDVNISPIKDMINLLKDALSKRTIAQFVR